MPYGDRKKKRRLHTDWRKWDRGAKERVYLQLLAEETLERSRELESQGWEAWYATIMGDKFVTNLAPHHVEALDWHWTNIMRKRAGLDVEKDAYLAIWPRGHRKSNLIRAIAVCDAALSEASYCLYVSGTKAKVRGHAITIETLLSTPEVVDYYPRLTKLERRVTGAQKSWTADLLYAQNAVFHFIGLSEGVAGANIDNVRPTLIIFDDIDDREDSPLISETRLKVLTRSVIPTRQHNTLIFCAQNYISRHGCIYRIHTGKERALAKRVHTSPIPAIYNLVTEPRTIDGIVHDIITSGTPSWDYYDIPRCQEEIDTIGLSAFMAELQHDVDQDKAGTILPEWNEDVHIINWDDFEREYGTREIPSHWKQYIGHDWASTGADKGHACVVLFFAVAAMNSPHPGTVFLHQVMTFPESVLAGTVAHSILDFVLHDNQRDPKTWIELNNLDRATGDPSDALAQHTRNRVVKLLVERPQYAMWHMSHEQKAVRDIYRVIYGLNFQPCNPKRAGGVEQLRHHLRYDLNEPHPFKPQKFGLCRLYVLDNQDEGTKLVRTQLAEWSWRPPTLTAKGYLDERPMKQYDDVGNAAMMVFTHFQMVSTPLTYRERVEQAIPMDLRYSELLRNSPFEAGLTPEQELAHLTAVRLARKSVKGNIRRFDEYGEPII